MRAADICIGLCWNVENNLCFHLELSIFLPEVVNVVILPVYKGTFTFNYYTCFIRLNIIIRYYNIALKFNKRSRTSVCSRL